MKKFLISLIIPAYNEEKKIETDIRQAYRYFKKHHLSAEVIVSTDGVTDATNSIVKKLQMEFPTLSLLAEKEKIGKGAAIKKGVAMASGQYVMFADAGLCVSFDYITTGIAHLEKNFDCVLASRATKKSIIRKAQPLYRKLGSKIFGYLVRNMLGVPRQIRDTQCGFKLYKHQVAKTLFNELQTKGFMFDIEIILRAKKKKFSMIQFPVEWSNDADTKFDPLTGSIKNIQDLWKIKMLYRL